MCRRTLKRLPPLRGLELFTSTPEPNRLISEIVIYDNISACNLFELKVLLNFNHPICI